jgi:extracellular factor (EF) 3-hydroxypalmitic acid methyl ester biosynthesis protein
MPPHLPPWTDDRKRLLDRTCQELLEADDIDDTMDRLSAALWWYRAADRPGWKTWVHEHALRHPVCALLHQDPFTHRAFAKPRGFAGDAVMLDLVYFDQGWVGMSGVSELGRRLNRRNRAAGGPRAVRERRNHMAETIDSSALRSPDARVLSVAGGHLREAMRSIAIKTGALAEMVVFDQDGDALATVASALGPRVRCVHGAIRSITEGRALPRERFDCIYAAGLYDYLPRPKAACLTEHLFEMLREGGQLLIANFTPDFADAGYTESFMDWDLICRTPDELMDLTANLPASVRANATLYTLSSPELVYLRLTRA